MLVKSAINAKIIIMQALKSPGTQSSPRVKFSHTNELKKGLDLHIAKWKPALKLHKLITRNQFTLGPKYQI